MTAMRARLSRLGKRVSVASIALLLLAGCQASEPLPTRDVPDRAGPFGEIGYRNMQPNPIPKTEIPNSELTSLIDCAGGPEAKEASRWLRDWFAAVSRLDQCDEWAIQTLSQARTRDGLVYILERVTAEKRDVAQCLDASFKTFTRIEEMHARLSGWRNHKLGNCSFARLKQVSDSRQDDFARKLSSVAGDIDTYRGRNR